MMSIFDNLIEFTDPKDFADHLRDSLGMDIPEGATAWISGVDWGTGESCTVLQVQPVDVPMERCEPVAEIKSPARHFLVSGRHTGKLDLVRVWFSPYIDLYLGTSVGLRLLEYLFESWCYR
jgi:hypothetical protein